MNVDTLKRQLYEALLRIDPDELSDNDADIMASLAKDPAIQARLEPGVVRCPEKLKPGGCTLHNLHCGWPECNK